MLQSHQKAFCALDVASKGQVFTPTFIVAKMLGLRRRRGRVLEPSCGDGAFLSALEPEAVGIEIDTRFNGDCRIRHGDFFAYSRHNKFDTIIGNPPYVRYQDISPATKLHLQNRGLFDRRSNLYLFFIDKCIDHLNMGGELIFITPRGFMQATSARKLNEKLYKQGSMTHYYELGDTAIFNKATPNCAIWRWVKGRTDRRSETGGDFTYKNGLLWFEKHNDNTANNRLGDYFDIRVGAVSGADVIFTHAERGCTDFACSLTARHGVTRRMIYNRPDKALRPHKQGLINRKIRKFDESNWWQWGRLYPHRDGQRIYVNCRTRNPKPFFVSNIKAYDGSLLALFPNKTTTGKIDLHEATAKLNAVSWQKLNFVCGGRLLFAQRSLANIAVELAL